MNTSIASFALCACLLALCACDKKPANPPAPKVTLPAPYDARVMVGPVAQPGATPAAAFRS